MPTTDKRISFYGRLGLLKVSEHIYIEIERENIQKVSTRVANRNRYPKAMSEHRFSIRTYTAISKTTPGEVRYLLRVERVH